jgi:hypothetical protein
MLNNNKKNLIKMDSFDANKVLSQDIVIKGAENHLYRIDLNLISNRSEKRNHIYNPLLIFSVKIVIFIKPIFSLLIPEENKKFLLIIGDLSHFFGMKTHFNIIIFLSTALALSSQLIYYYYYKSDIKQTYLKVFHMMLGLISPKHIGLTNKEEIYKLIRESKIIFSLCKWNTNIILPLIAFSVDLLPFIINSPPLDLIFFGIPHSILHILCTHYMA